MSRRQPTLTEVLARLATDEEELSRARAALATAQGRVEQTTWAIKSLIRQAKKHKEEYEGHLASISAPRPSCEGFNSCPPGFTVSLARWEDGVIKAARALSNIMEPEVGVDRPYSSMSILLALGFTEEDCGPKLSAVLTAINATFSCTRTETPEQWAARISKLKTKLQAIARMPEREIKLELLLSSLHSVEAASVGAAAAGGAAASGGGAAASRP